MPERGAQAPALRKADALGKIPRRGRLMAAKTALRQAEAGCRPRGRGKLGRSGLAACLGCPNGVATRRSACQENMFYFDAKNTFFEISNRSPHRKDPSKSRAKQQVVEDSLNIHVFHFSVSGENMPDANACLCV